MKDYNQYVFSKKEYITNILFVICIILIISILFFDNIFFCILLSPYIYIFMKNKRRKNLVEVKRKLRAEFSDVLEAVSVSLISGYSIENAFIQILDEIENLHGKDAMIVKELNNINRKIELGENIEEILDDFGRRSGVKEIQSFVDVFGISKRTEGNLVRVCNYSAKMIRRNCETEREVKTIISGKVNEMNIMKVMPIVLILYMRVTSAGFYDVVYNSILGNMIMLAFVIVYFVINFYVDNIISDIAGD